MTLMRANLARYSIHFFVVLKLFDHTCIQKCVCISCFQFCHINSHETIKVGNICRAIHQVTSKRTLLMENIRIEDINFGHHDINTIREFLENERGVILSAEISALERVLDSFHVAIVGWFHVNPNAVIANRLWDALADVYILDSSALHVKLESFRIVRSYVTRFELCDRLTFHYAGSCFETFETYARYNSRCIIRKLRRDHGPYHCKSPISSSKRQQVSQFISFSMWHHSWRK